MFFHIHDHSRIYSLVVTSALAQAYEMLTDTTNGFPQMATHASQ